MSEEKCFCHLYDSEGNPYAVKDKTARETLQAHEVLLQGLMAGGGVDAEGLNNLILRIETLEAKSHDPVDLSELTSRLENLEAKSHDPVDLSELTTRLENLEAKSHDPVDLSTLQAEVEYLKTSNTMLNTTVGTLQSQISVLNDEILALKANSGTGGNTGGDTPTLITFTIAGTSYQAEEGMTWGKWCDSSYNTSECNYTDYNDYNIYCSGNFVFNGDNLVCVDDVIQSGTAYTLGYADPPV